MQVVVPSTCTAVAVDDTLSASCGDAAGNPIYCTTSSELSPALQQPRVIAAASTGVSEQTCAYLRPQPWLQQLPHCSTKPIAALEPFEKHGKSSTPAKDSPAAPVQHSDCVS